MVADISNYDIDVVKPRQLGPCTLRINVTDAGIHIPGQNTYIDKNISVVKLKLHKWITLVIINSTRIMSPKFYEILSLILSPGSN